MSNNKQSMKLYTEEQVRHMLGGGMQPHWIDEFLLDYKHIEIPTDSELRKIAKKMCDGHQHAMRYNQMLICCFNTAKSAIDKIQGGNK